MARMIPPFIHADCDSYGEKQIFKKFRDEPGTRDWIVLHSLGLPRHVRQISGEIDFVVIVPGKGVLCLEVKACSSLSRRDGLWFYGKDSGGDPRGPFKQVSEGMHSLRKELSKDRPDFSHVPFFTAVIFPYIDFTFKPGEWHEWEVIDRKKFRSLPLGSLLNNILDQWRAHMRSTLSGSWFIKDSTEPYPQQCEAIVSHLRGDFEAHESGQSVIARNTDELHRFTHEQFDALDSMENNRRIVFCGPAGTGKTFLALEAARRADANGRKTLLVCYNKLLAEWAKSAAATLRNVDVFTIHSLMMRFTDAKPADDSQMFWEITLPELAQLALIEKNSESDLYDTLIVDEGQDLLNAPYLDLLDLVLKGGLTAGNWRMFGDFEKQRIYRNSNLSVNSFKNDRCGGVPEMRLSVNCRNTPRIGAWVQTLGKLNPGYSRFRRSDNGIEPEMIFFKRREEQPAMLLKQLDQLAEEGFSSQDMVILSPYGSEASVVSALEPSPWKDRLRPYKVEATGHLGHATIHAFKGLEAQIVIVTDVDQVRGDDDLNLLYVALSRAVYKAVIFASESVRSDLLKLISVVGKASK